MAQLHESGKKGKAMTRTIVVKGIGKASVAPDLLVLALGMDVVDLDYGEMMRLATEEFEAIREALVGVGFQAKDLKTSRYSITTKYEGYHDDNNNWLQRFVGYECSHKLSVEFDLDIELLGKALVALADSPANPTLNIQFTIRDKDAVGDLLLDKAIKDATSKAGVLAKASQVTLGEIISIDYNWAEHHFYSETDMAVGGAVPRGMALRGASMDIEPEDIDVRDTVAVTWAIQ
jgi:uncharacterized protein YggE